MTRPRPRPNLVLLAILCLLPVAAESQEQILRHNYPAPFGDTSVEVQSVFGAAARQGALPFRITIRNNSGRDRIWTLVFEEGNYGRGLSTRSTYRFAVEDGREITEEVVFAYAPSFLAYDYRTLRVKIISPGLPEEDRNHGEQTNPHFPSLGISHALAQRSLTRLDDAIKNTGGNAAFAKRFDSEHLPRDWRGYSGLDALLLDLPAWRTLSAAQRQALVSWIRLGGRLDLYAEDPIEPASLGLRFTSAKAEGAIHRLSFGEVRLRTWDGSELPDHTVDFYRGFTSRAKALDQDYGMKWSLLAAIGVREFNPTLIFLLLVGFAVLVAPVNLFYLAGPGRRHRLFVTTPIISVATCALIVVFILFFDGIGGKGLRSVYAELQGGSGEARLYVVQEQVSRTGVMVGTGFANDRLYELSPVNLPASAFNPLTSDGRRSATYDINGGRFEGGLFPSRSEQGFAIRSVEPSRARIELAAGGGEGEAPALVSNLPSTLTAFHYLDPSGRAWTLPEGAEAGPGQRIPLEEIADRKPPEWMKESAERFSKTQSLAILALQKEKNRFFAQIRDPETFALPTHPRLRWEQTHLLLTGTPTGAESAASDLP